MSNVSEQEKGDTHRDGEPDVSPSPATVWEAIDDIMSGVPDEVLKRLPADGAERHDHYLRGTHAEAPREQ
jgi:hypothetical protein